MPIACQPKAGVTSKFNRRDQAADARSCRCWVVSMQNIWENEQAASKNSTQRLWHKDTQPLAKALTSWGQHAAEGQDTSRW